MTPGHSLVLMSISFCRISGFLMITPGFSGDRTPVLLRLYLSLAISIFSDPTIGIVIPFIPSILGYSFISHIFIHEFIVGIFLGLSCRCFIFALETLITAFCYTIGLSNIFNPGIIDAETYPALSSLTVITTIQLFFITDLHSVFIQGIVNSYKIIPLDSRLDPSAFLVDLTYSISQSYSLVLKISSPIILFSIIINLAFSLLARLSQNIPVYFVSGPCILFLGIVFFNFHSVDFFSALIYSFRETFLRS